MIIRKANKEDLYSIMLMYESCVKGMLANGIDQWDDTYPNTEIISQDLEMMTYYVSIFNEEIIFKGKIGRIRDIKIQNETGEIYMLSDNGELWRMYK